MEEITWVKNKAWYEKHVISHLENIEYSSMIRSQVVHTGVEDMRLERRLG